MPTDFVRLTERDSQLFRLLNKTPITSDLILKASESFLLQDDPHAFPSRRRVNDRLQQLVSTGWLRCWPVSVYGSGRPMYYYKLSVRAYRFLHGPEVPLPQRAFFDPIAPSRMEHTLRLADVIVHIIVHSHRIGAELSKYHRENALAITAAGQTQQPDFHCQFAYGGVTFNELYEIDMGTAPVEGIAASSIRNKIRTYEAHYDDVWRIWDGMGRPPPRPRFRVVFLSPGMERSHHILHAAWAIARNPKRRLCLAASFESFLSHDDPLRCPLFLDHNGRRQALLNTRPSCFSSLDPVELVPLPVESALVF